MNTKKLLIGAAVAVILLLLLIAYWTYDTRRTVKNIDERITTLETVQSLRLLARLVGDDGDCGQTDALGTDTHDLLYPRQLAWDNSDDT